MGRSGQKFRDKFKRAQENRERTRENKRRFLYDNRDGSVVREHKKSA